MRRTSFVLACIACVSQARVHADVDPAALHALAMLLQTHQPRVGFNPAHAAANFAASKPTIAAARAQSPAMALSPTELSAELSADLPTALAKVSSLMAEIVDSETGERIYGAVDAPLWVAPVGAILAIGTSLLPVLLAPGEKALIQQRKDEATFKEKIGQGQLFGALRPDIEKTRKKGDI
mmetsp:Transcript_2232/g.3847  ORF Transcript_2232/g.3847 Transcript_2232/m.3847 type:complete len:180 (-) Transcript_2232:116-655(-)